MSTAAEFRGSVATTSVNAVTAEDRRSVIGLRILANSRPGRDVRGRGRAAWATGCTDRRGAAWVGIARTGATVIYIQHQPSGVDASSRSDTPALGSWRPP